MINLTLENFEEEILKSDKLVIVDIFTNWCAPCKLIAPVFEGLSTEMSDVKFVKANAEDVPNFCDKYNVHAVPTFLIFSNGKVIDTKTGATRKEDISEFIIKAKEIALKG